MFYQYVIHIEIYGMFDVYNETSRWKGVLVLFSPRGGLLCVLPLELQGHQLVLLWMSTPNGQFAMWYWEANPQWFDRKSNCWVVFLNQMYVKRFCVSVPRVLPTFLSKARCTVLYEPLPSFPEKQRLPMLKTIAEMRLFQPIIQILSHIQKYYDPHFLGSYQYQAFCSSPTNSLAPSY